MEEKNIELQGIKTCYWEAGDKSKPVILCLHGFGMNGLSFIELTEILKTNFYFISLDLPGFGRTEPFEKQKDYEMPNLIKWVNEFTKAINLTNFYLLGHSWGAKIGLFFFAEHAEKIKKIILLDGGYWLDEMYVDYNNDHDHIFGDFTSIEDMIEKNIERRHKNINSIKYSTLEEAIESEMEGNIRWSPLLDKYAAELYVYRDGFYRIKTTGDTMEKVQRAWCDFQPDSVYGKVNKLNAASKLLLLQAANESQPGEKARDLIDCFLTKFQTETGALVKHLPVQHRMHWDNPDLIRAEIVEWFK